MVRRTSDKGLDLIKDYEGFRARSYKDIAGHWTIGYGHLITEREFKTGKFDERSNITIGYATELLREDVAKAENMVNKKVNVKVTQSQFDAMVSFAFNLGNAAFSRSTMLKRVNEKDWFAAAEQFLKWVYAGGRKRRGLLRRRLDEARLFVSENWAR
jgi:lysozyme